METLSRARDLGEAVVTAATDSVQDSLRRRVRHALGVRGRPPVSCEDPGEAYQPVDGAARLLHGDLPSMLIGGVASLLLQLLHPAVMRGVADHSRYKEDALGRLARTAAFVGTTTYGSKSDARAAIDRVRRIHETVSGADASGQPYTATDPHLLEWVHLTEVAMFLRGATMYGPRIITETFADRYVAEMAQVARDLGVPAPPIDVTGMHRRLGAYRDELALTTAGMEARDFLLRGVSANPLRRATYTTVAVAAVGLLPGWARSKLDVVMPPLSHEVIIRPTATVLTTLMRVAVPPRAPVTSRS